MRKSLQLSVDIYNCGSYLGRGTTRDIHIDGAFIEGCADGILQNDILELYIFSSEDDQLPVFLTAMVVRNSSQGVGVLFGCGEREFRWLLSTLGKISGNGGMHEAAHAGSTVH
jgi:hypothetical protein